MKYCKSKNAAFLQVMLDVVGLFSIPLFCFFLFQFLGARSKCWKFNLKFGRVESKRVLKALRISIRGLDYQRFCGKCLNIMFDKL